MALAVATRKPNSAPAAAPQVQPSTEQPTTNAAPAAQPGQAATPAKAEPKAKSPEQRAAAMRREAGELKRAAKTLGESTDGGKSLLARATGLETDADALAPRKSKSTENRPTCAGTKKDGTPCTAHAMESSPFCTDHRPVRARFTDEEWAAFATIPQAVIVDRLGWGVALKLAKEQAALNANAAKANAQPKA